METGRVINRRYLLQRLIKQGQVCTVFQGVDQVLHRTVAVKVVPPAQVPMYRTSIRQTSQFSHPNIIGLYDVIVEPEALYIVQEYVDGDELAALQQVSLSAYEVADFGYQICQALAYAGSSSRKVNHGDLTPAAVLRDHTGLVRVNNFALPSDQYYFQAWSVLGNRLEPISDFGTPWGQQTEGRRADDTRAVGLLLYQLVAARNPEGTGVEPSPDGRLRFQRNYPAELCDLIARTLISQHPQHISTPETLLTELKGMVDTYDPPPEQPVAVGVAQSRKELARASSQQYAPPSGKLTLPGSSGVNLGNYPPQDTPSASNNGFQMAQQASYSSPEPSRFSGPLLWAICLVTFIVCFLVGFFIIARLILHM